MNKRQREAAKRVIEAKMQEHGGYGKKALLAMNVPWPPPRKWKERLISYVVRTRTVDGFSMAPQRPTNFYSSWEWKAARYEALKMYGQRCQCCGWRPGDTARGYLTVDHIKPRSKHPELALSVENLQVLCNDCNMGKSNVWEDDFRSLEDWFSNLMRE